MQDALHHPRYRRSNRYDPDWVIANQMGPNALWLLESLTEVLPVEEGTRVLDLGCGRALTSIFLAREFGARVWATDLWIAAADNRRRLAEAGVGHLVEAVHAEAHALPFDDGFFDLVVSIDAYHYFGTDDLYLGHLVRYLGEGGRIGAVMPGLVEEIDEVPSHLAPFWEWEFWSFHSPAWWRRHWAKTGLVTVDHADLVEGGWRDWQRWCRITEPQLDGRQRQAAAHEAAMLEADRGRTLGFTRIVATKA